MRPHFARIKLKQAVLLIAAASLHATALAYPSGAPVVPPKPKCVEQVDLDPVAYPTGTPVVPPKPKASQQNQSGWSMRSHAHLAW